MKKTAPRIFFSSSRKDSDFVLRLAGDMKASGVDVWLDQLDIKASEWWDISVQDALKECPRLLIVLSPEAVSSRDVLDEVSFGLDNSKLVIPVLYRNCEN